LAIGHPSFVIDSSFEFRHSNLSQIRRMAFEVACVVADRGPGMLRDDASDFICVSRDQAIFAFDRSPFPLFNRSHTVCRLSQLVVAMHGSDRPFRPVKPRPVVAPARVRAAVNCRIRFFCRTDRTAVPTAPPLRGRRAGATTGRGFTGGKAMMLQWRRVNHSRNCSWPLAWRGGTARGALAGSCGGR
jgi:hypothetical protein